MEERDGGGVQLLVRNRREREQPVCGCLLGGERERERWEGGERRWY